MHTVTPEILVACAFLLDLAAGDPRWLPHPVRLMGALAVWTERITRAAIPWEFLAGVAGWLVVVGLSSIAAHGVVRAAALWHPVAGQTAAVLLIYVTLSPRDLMAHAERVRQALAAQDLPEARRRVGMIVGRETNDLDEEGVARAAVESVAESLGDGVIAPLLYAFLLGPTGAIAYRAANTLDSMWGYRNERYRRFGTAAARLDDLLSWAPARLSGFFVILAAAVSRASGRDAFRILRRDARLHASPNAGYPEAAMAGALGIQLGGPSTYFGKVVQKASLGDRLLRIHPNHIRRANRLMLLAAALFLLAGMAVAWKVRSFFASHGLILDGWIF